MPAWVGTRLADVVNSAGFGTVAELAVAAAFVTRAGIRAGVLKIVADLAGAGGSDTGLTITVGVAGFDPVASIAVIAIQRNTRDASTGLTSFYPIARVPVVAPDQRTVASQADNVEVIPVFPTCRHTPNTDRTGGQTRGIGVVTIDFPIRRLRVAFFPNTRLYLSASPDVLHPNPISIPAVRNR